VSFSGFTQSDFDAYSESKWTSNVYNLERLQVRQKLVQLGKALTSDLRAVDGSLLSDEVSVESPAVWNGRKVDHQTLFFSRSETARRELNSLLTKGRSIASMLEDPSPLRNHIFLAITIDYHRLELALKVHADATVDRENLQRKCHEFFHREKLLHLIQQLGPEFQVGLAGQQETTADQLGDEVLQRLIGDHLPSKTWLSIHHRMPRTDPRLISPEFVDVARDQSLKLLPILHYIAWARDNDHLAVREVIKEQQSKKQSKGLAKNDQVRVVRGLFSGKVGVVQGLGDKGAVRVQLGNVAITLNAEDLVKK
jgi:hypothetical protein